MLFDIEKEGCQVEFRAEILMLLITVKPFGYECSHVFLFNSDFSMPNAFDLRKSSHFRNFVVKF